MDYPFNMKGILYFPKINMEYESIEGKIKLYNNQVFVADNIKEVIPEFLMLLKGRYRLSGSAAQCIQKCASERRHGQEDSGIYNEEGCREAFRHVQDR
jgi:hypothetical protein